MGNGADKEDRRKRLRKRYSNRVHIDLTLSEGDITKSCVWLIDKKRRILDVLETFNFKHLIRKDTPHEQEYHTPRDAVNGSSRRFE